MRLVKEEYKDGRIVRQVWLTEDGIEIEDEVQDYIRNTRLIVPPERPCIGEPPLPGVSKCP